MNTKRIVRWVIVLFLLAALPGLTVALAQEQEPAKGMPVEITMPASVADWGETPVTPTISEVESNNTKATAMWIDIINGEVVGGQLNGGDVDWYKFYVPSTLTNVLIDTDAIMDGGQADTVLKLFDESASTTPISQNDDMGGYPYFDSVLYAVLRQGWYYVQVSNYSGNCASACAYDVIIARPNLFSAAAANLGTGYVEGIPFRSEDVLSLQPFYWDAAGRANHKWRLFMDGSDIGITKPVVNISTGWQHNYGNLTLTFGANQVLRDWSGVNRTFKPWDWAMVPFERVGTNTQLWINENGYPAVEYHAGAEHGLTTTAEKPDALDVNQSYAVNPAWTADVFFSTVGVASVPTGPGEPGIVRAADEDLIRSQTWDGHWLWHNSLHFDGSTVPGLAVEDIYAADYEFSRERLFLVILGNGNIMGHTVTQKDIFWLNKSGSSWTWGGLYHLPDYGWNYNLDAYEHGGN